MEPVTAPDQASAKSPARPREEGAPPVDEHNPAVESPAVPAPGADIAASPNGESEYRIEDSFNCAVRVPREVFDNLIRELDSPTPKPNPGLEELFRRVKRIKERRGECFAILTKKTI